MKIITEKLKKQKTIDMIKLNKHDGITLIVLVVTVVILLILAGITISTLTGDNGLIKNARKSKRRYRN